MSKNTFRKLNSIFLSAVFVFALSGCDAKPVVSLDANTSSTYSTTIPDSETATASTPGKKALDNTPICLECIASGELTEGNEFATVDYSNYADGYIIADYLGSSAKTKLQIKGPDGVTYTYDIAKGAASFPLSSGNGAYSISVCENISDTKYSVVFATTLNFDKIDEFGPYLHPNQYVNYNEKTKTVTKGAELAKGCTSKLEVVTSVYEYITENIKYDYDKADTVKSGYVPDVDTILESNIGICLDYAAVMTAMLRTQSIPTRLEVGYTGADMVYHAWISVYIEDIGWLNGIIQFNGKQWTLVDPTFGASMGDKKLKKYIGEGSNYSIKYIY